jgi:AcrR family transcriptional regulator
MARASASSRPRTPSVDAGGRRPSPPDATADTRERLLAAAEQLFAQEGYATVSVRAMQQRGNLH